MNYLINFKDIDSEYAKNEIIKLVGNNNIEIWNIEEGIGIIKAVDGHNLRQQTNFIQQAYPIDAIFETTEILSIKEFVINKLNKGVTYNIHAISDSHNHNSSKAFRNSLVKIINDTDHKYNPKNPNEVIMYCLLKEKVYMGIVKMNYLFSSWPKGCPKFKQDINSISRAENKLLEVLEIIKKNYQINLKSKKALDLGAAPGGWSKVLLDNGITVTAVDPAKINLKLFDYTNFRHYNGTAQQFLQEGTLEEYDLVVNDMKMNGVASFKIMDDLYKILPNGCLYIMTLKLPQNKHQSHTMKVLEKIPRKYRIILARRLSYNRNEITIVFQK